jgi:streptogramin lyase
VSAPGDLSVSNLRGIGWVVSLGDQRVVAFGPDLDDPAPQRMINAVGHPRVVEAGTLDLSVWVGSEEGTVYRFRAQDAVLTREWALQAGAIRAIALDEAAATAWVATLSGGSSDLYHLDPATGDSTRIRTGLSNVADLAVDPATGDLWISERGLPNRGAGRLSLITRSGAEVMSISGVEPYGIDVDATDGTCWFTELQSDRLLHVDRSGSVLRSSPTLQTPYAVRVSIP